MQITVKCKLLFYGVTVKCTIKEIFHPKFVATTPTKSECFVILNKDSSSRNCVTKGEIIDNPKQNKLSPIILII